MTTATKKETLSFQAEVDRVLHLVINSLYSNKEIFLRELISNASDACDKLRFLAVADDKLYENDSDLKIAITVDKDARTIMISDNGIGMDREEIIKHLGSIAHSGTRQFLENMTGDKAKDSQLIGQFGVGFYSAFIIADNVVVRSRRAGLSKEQGVRWESSGDGKFTVEATEKSARGTDIIIHLKSEADEFLDDFRIRGIVHKYSDHISFPIMMQKMSFDEDKEKAEKKAPEWEMVNRAKALWTLPKSEISDEDYKTFYKHVAHDFQDPLLWSHNRVEGNVEYTMLVYIPERKPFDLYNRDFHSGIKLYVKRVFIMDEAEQLLPNYLRFVKGVVDANDLPLNVSREILQSSKVVETIKTGLTKRVLSMLEKLAQDDKEQYQKFWQEFGLVLKEGPAEDIVNRERIAKLLRFASTYNDESSQTVSLDDYISRMKEGQDKIYYITADSFNAAKNSPNLEILRKKGIEVLLMYDRIDEWLFSHLNEYQGKHLQAVTKGQLDLGALEDKEQQEELKKTEKTFDSVIKQMKNVLGDKVEEIRLTHRLTDSPACVVWGEYDMGLQMKQILKAAGQTIPDSKPILEINPEHDFLKQLKDEQDDHKFGEWTKLLFEQGLLAAGAQLDDPAGFVKCVNNILLNN